MNWKPLLDALALGSPIIVTATVALYLSWVRVRRARLRAERQKLPPSTEPPQPKIPWYSLKPRPRARRNGKGDLS